MAWAGGGQTQSVTCGWVVRRPTWHGVLLRPSSISRYGVVGYAPAGAADNDDDDDDGGGGDDDGAEPG